MLLACNFNVSFFHRSFIGRVFYVCSGQVERLQEKFAGIHQYLCSSPGVSSTKDAAEEFSMLKLQDQHWTLISAAVGWTILPTATCIISLIVVKGLWGLKSPKVLSCLTNIILLLSSMNRGYSNQSHDLKFLLAGFGRPGRWRRWESDGAHSFFSPKNCYSISERCAPSNIMDQCRNQTLATKVVSNVL